MIVLHDLVLAKVSKEPEMRGGLYLPDSSRKRSQEAVVLGVGPLVPDVKIGDRVLITPFSGTDLDDERTLFSSRDILAVLVEVN